MAGETVWLFQGNRVSQPSAACSELGRAVHIIAQRSLSGLLTEYPLNEGVYDWAVRRGFYRPKGEPDPIFIGKFTSASQKHYHFEHGRSPELPPSLTQEATNHSDLHDSTGQPADNLVWVFLGEQARQASAVFDDEPLAYQWCAKHRLTGLLRPLPLNIPVYDWARTHGIQDPWPLQGPEVIANYWIATDRDVSFLDGLARPAKPARLQVS